MPNYWIEALKTYNKDKSQWCLPKRDTEEYKKVVEIMNKLKQKQTQNKVEKSKPEPQKIEKPKKETKPVTQQTKKETTTQQNKQTYTLLGINNKIKENDKIVRELKKENKMDEVKAIERKSNALFEIYRKMINKGVDEVNDINVFINKEFKGQQQKDLLKLLQ